MKHTDALSTNYNYRNAPPKKTFNKASVHLELNYKMDHQKRGIALIFNHYEFDIAKPNCTNMERRYGTEKDFKKVCETFKELKFAIQPFKDLTKDELMKAAQNAASMDHTNSDCLAVIIMTHGSIKYEGDLAQTVLWARDQAYHLEELTNLFTGDKCRSLLGKPKLFFIQACRGLKIMEGVRCHIDSTDIFPRLPKHADFLYMHSSPKEYVSYRNPKDGTWFIQTLCNQLMKRYQKQDLLNILVAVNRHVAIHHASSQHNMKQICEITSCLTKILYFKKHQITTQATPSKRAKYGDDNAT